MLQVAVSYSKFGTSKSGGARKSLLALLDGAAEEWNISVDAYQTPPVDDPPTVDFEYQIYDKSLHSIPKFTWANQVVNRIQWKRYLKKQLSPEYDLLITQNRLAPVSIQVANELNIQSLFFVRSMALTGYEKFTPNHGHIANLFNTDFGGLVQYPLLRKNFYDYYRAAKDATRTISNSEFTKEKIRNLFETNSDVIYPPIEVEKYKVQYDNSGFITMANPRAAYKGLDIFLEISAKLPDESFLLVGPISSENLKKRVNQLSNVTHWEWCEDMREAYSASKLVVVPSRWEEPFGRVPAEAMVSGIPCVVSDKGGLPEVVGDTGEVVTKIESVDAWISAIGDAFEKHDPEAQRKRSEQFSASQQVEKFVEIIDATVKPDF